MDYRALKEGKTIELMNFFHFDGAEMTLRHITLSGVRFHGAALEAGNTDPMHAHGLMKSLGAFGFNHQASQATPLMSSSTTFSDPARNRASIPPSRSSPLEASNMLVPWRRVDAFRNLRATISRPSTTPKWAGQVRPSRRGSLCQRWEGLNGQVSLFQSFT